MNKDVADGIFSVIGGGVVGFFIASVRELWRTRRMPRTMWFRYRDPDR